MPGQRGDSCLAKIHPLLHMIDPGGSGGVVNGGFILLEDRSGSSHPLLQVQLPSPRVTWSGHNQNEP